MAAYYTYFISSLPMLNFSAKLPFSLEEFFVKCNGLVPEKEIELLKNACYNQAYLFSVASQNALRRWANFEATLRNELVRLRSQRRKADPLKFVRLPEEFDARVNHVAMVAYRSSSLLEAEKLLDQERWDFLDSLSFGHYFDFDFLLFYALKLKILERWDTINKADKENLFNATLLN